MPDLRPGQYKRLGRIEEKNPERALRVADRMNKRASREDRGKNVSERQKELKAPFEKNRPIGRAMAEKRPDTPLAPTPEPRFRDRAEARSIDRAESKTIDRSGLKKMEDKINAEIKRRAALKEGLNSLKNSKM